MSDHRIHHDMKYAEAILDAYADMEGLTNEECLNVGLFQAQCTAVLPALGKGAEGIVTSEERAQMEAVGLSPAFIDRLASNALDRRTRWLADHAVTRWYRHDYDINERRWMIAELTAIGLQNEVAMLAFAEFAAQWENEAVILPILRRHAAATVEGAIHLLHHPDAERRLQAVGVLKTIGELPSRRTAIRAIPALVTAVGDPDEDVQRAVLWCLSFIYDEKSHTHFREILSAVQPLLAIGNKSVIRSAAIETLGKIGRYDKTVRDTIIPLLAAIAVNKQEEADLRKQATHELSCMSSSHKELVMPTMQSLMRDPDFVAEPHAYLASVFDGAGWRSDAVDFFQKRIEAIKSIERERDRAHILEETVVNLIESKFSDTTKEKFLKQCVVLAEQIKDKTQRADLLSTVYLLLKKADIRYEALSQHYIFAHGYPFQIESDQPLAQHQKGLLISALEQYPPPLVKLLAEGREGEPPLSFVIADRFRSPLFQGKHGADGQYTIVENRISYDRMNMPDEIDQTERTQWLAQYVKGAIAHEIGHALGDFAVTRHENFTMDEIGIASVEYENQFTMDKNYRKSEPFQFFIVDQGFGNHFGETNEDVASIIAYLQDPQRHDRMNEVLKKRFNSECISVAGRCFSPADFEAQDPFIQSVKAFLDHYPHIPGVKLEDQYDTGVWLPIVRLRIF